MEDELVAEWKASLTLNLRNPGRGFESRRRQNLVVKAKISCSLQALAGVYPSTKMGTALPVITEG